MIKNKKKDDLQKGKGSLDINTYLANIHIIEYESKVTLSHVHIALFEDL